MKIPILVALGSLLAFYSAPADILKKAEVTAVINDVKLVEPGAGERGAKVNDVVQGATAVRTGIQSRSELLFQDKTLTRLGANTLFSFTQGTRDLELEHGTMLLQCPKGIGGAKIRTAAVTAAITGTTILIEYFPAPGLKRASGYIPTIAEMTPEECYAELQHPRRTYTRPERSALETRAKQRKKGGSGGYVKVLVLEGTLRLYLNTRVGESVLIAAGHMIILDPQAITIPPAVEFDIKRLAETSLLVDNKFWGHVATDLSMAIVAKEVTIQNKEIELGQLLATNLVIPGPGTEVVTLAQLDQSIQAQEVAILSQLPPVVSGGPIVTPPGLPPITSNLPTPPAGSGSPPSVLTTITSPDPYLVGSGSVISTDPSITTNGVTDYGTDFNQTTNGDPAVFIFGSRSAFDNTTDFGNNNSSSNNKTYAVFRFSNLQLSGVPGIVTTGGTPDLALISEGPITTSLPGGVFNVDVLQGLFMATVNGSITMGPEFSFTSTATFVPVQNGNNSDGLQFYARGATSDVVFGSNVTFADRRFELDAEHNVVVSSQITALSSSDPLTRYDDDVDIFAGNNFILTPTGQITASRLNIQALDVAGSGGALVNSVNLEIDTQNAATLTQSGGLLYVETLPISQTNLQFFKLSGNAGVNVPGNVTVTSDLQFQTNQNFIMGPGAQLTAHSVEIDSISGGVTLPGDATFSTAPNPGNNTNFVGVQINGDGENTGPNGSIPGAAGDVTINGHLTTNNSLQIRAQSGNNVPSGNFILGPSGRITAPDFEVDTKDVMGSGSAVVDGAAAQISINIQNAATLTQSGNLVYVNTLPIDQTSPMQNLSITSTTGVNIPSNVNINNLTGNNTQFQLNSNGALNINGTLTSTSQINVQVQSLVVGPSALLRAPSVQVDLVGAATSATVDVSGSNLLFNSLPIDLSLPNSDVQLSARTINVAPNLILPNSNSGANIGQTYPVFTAGVFTGWTLDNVQVPGNITSNGGLNFDGNATVTGNVTTGGLGLGVLTAGGTVNANFIYWNGANSNQNSGQAPQNGAGVSSPASLTAPVVNANSGLNFAGGNEGSGMTFNNNGLPDDGHVLTLTTGTVLFDRSSAGPFIGPATFDGGDALSGGSNPGGNGGTLNVNATGDITVNPTTSATAISATTGANATSVASGGIGGTVNLTTTGGAVTVNAIVQVSSNDAPNRKVSKQGGNITLQTSKASGTGIQVTNSGQLLSLLNATLPGPGGTVLLKSAGADINVDGKIQADGTNGTIDIHNSGPSGLVNITSNAQLSADVIKAGALDANGRLTISAGAQINATTMLKLYGGTTGPSGLVLFTGVGNVNLSGSTIHIAATTVQVGGSTHVNNSGSTFVHATTHSYGIGAGGGNFQNPVTAGPVSGAPSY